MAREVLRGINGILAGALFDAIVIIMPVWLRQKIGSRLYSCTAALPGDWSVHFDLSLQNFFIAYML